MATYAVIDKSGQTVNVIEWDGKTAIALPAGDTTQLFVPPPDPGPAAPVVPPMKGAVDFKAVQSDIAAIKSKLGM